MFRNFRFLNLLLAVAIFSITLASPCYGKEMGAPSGKQKNKQPGKTSIKGSDLNFLGKYFYELTMSDDEPPVSSECNMIDKKMDITLKNLKCSKSDETTKLFWSFNCSETDTSKKSFAVILGGRDQCEKALQDFRARF